LANQHNHNDQSHLFHSPYQGTIVSNKPRSLSALVSEAECSFRGHEMEFPAFFLNLTF